MCGQKFKKKKEKKNLSLKITQEQWNSEKNNLNSKMSYYIETKKSFDIILTGICNGCDNDNEVSDKCFKGWEFV